MLEKTSAKKLFVGGGILLAGALFLYILGAGHKEGAALKVLSDRVDFQIKDFHYTEVGNPDLTWEINADTARYIKKDDVTLFENVTVKIIFSDGGVYTLAGKNGSLHTDTKDMDIDGNVVVVSDEGARFETDSLHYTHGNDNGRIHTKDAVKMTRPGTDVRGVGMNLSLGNREVTLLSSVRATIEGGHESN
ncbi:MAG: LPS export ABC transporter periplasmic protein LptC [Syntrophales bacterium]|nr:LPS export ABC transporter periplasmic protein LptC [Syntrophales bacterium]